MFRMPWIRRRLPDGSSHVLIRQDSTVRSEVMPTRASRRSLSPSRGRWWVVGAYVAVVVTLAGASSTLAHEAHGHPARIHEGTCEALGPAAFRLNGVGGSVDQDGSPIATPTAVNIPAAHEVVLSETLIEAPISDILGAEHAVMVYESDEEMTAITCGNIGGAMLGDILVTALAESGVPGHVGFAVFRPEGEETLVSLYLAHGLAELSAADAGADDQAEGEDADHALEEDDHGAEATPSA